MPLNYSKWDQLELSDDSDIEGHPNVDKRSLIRWKQRDIHEKREVRKHKITALHAEIDCNRVLTPRLHEYRAKLASNDGGGPEYFSSLVEQLQMNPSPDAPPTNAQDQPTYDAMVLSLLLQIWEEAKKAGVDKSDQGKLGAALLSGLDTHIAQLAEHTITLEKDLDIEEKEQKKHITSDDIHEGFESKYTPAQPAPPPVPNAKIEAPTKKTAKKTTMEYEVLNPASSSTSAPAASSSTPPPDSEDDEELPELTPDLETFSRLPLWGYAESFAFIQAHRGVVVPGASDALLVAAFRAQSDGQPKYAKQCVHQSLLLQYGDKLGRDGVRVFFQKMISGDKRATSVFEKDVEDTYAHLVTRVEASKEPSPQKEQIQLVPENSQSTISFNVPDGPPPEDLRLEGPGTEDLDVEQVRRALQARWDIFSNFSTDLQDALKEGTLERVNQVLGEMDVAEAENVVQLLDMGGIMSFADGGVRDETGKDEEIEE
ncbi:Cdc37 N terminal kinase binding-domain-containing protein [Hygrophoropsis aurantiaca]|uniref:Cdc37 N terminal kinase binding-domain-containing protein n=1 Tax=Hygrophoropsis aurantiaca TaxID=72124 RepID=A0ACB8AG68_9AGAM|nr:Cdc37 N terminal kinase binding-domain-containing protein [Hygrophoropsis aurantiaca]